MFSFNSFKAIFYGAFFSRQTMFPDLDYDKEAEKLWESFGETFEDNIL